MIFVSILSILVQAVAAASFLVSQPSPYYPEFLQEMQVGRDIKLVDLWRYRFALPLLMHAGVLKKIKLSITFKPEKHLRDVHPLLLLPALPEKWNFGLFGNIPDEHLVDAPEGLKMQEILGHIVDWHSAGKPIGYEQLAAKYGLLQVLCRLEDVASNYGSGEFIFPGQEAFAHFENHLDNLAAVLYQSTPGSQNYQIAATMSRHTDFVKVLKFLLHDKFRLQLYTRALNGKEVALPAEISHQDPDCVTSLIVPIIKQTLNVFSGFQIWIHDADLNLFQDHFTAEECKDFVRYQCSNGNYMEYFKDGQGEGFDRNDMEVIVKIMKTADPIAPDVLGYLMGLFHRLDLKAFFGRRIVAHAVAGGENYCPPLNNPYFRITRDFLRGIINGTFIDPYHPEWKTRAQRVLAIVEEPEGITDVDHAELAMAYAVNPDLPWQEGWNIITGFYRFGNQNMIKAAWGAGKKDLVEELFNLNPHIPQVEELCPILAQLKFETIERYSRGVSRYICVEEVFKVHGKLPNWSEAIPNTFSFLNHQVVVGEAEFCDETTSYQLSGKIFRLLYEFPFINPPIWFLAQIGNVHFIRVKYLPTYESAFAIRNLFQQSVALRKHAYEMAVGLLSDLNSFISIDNSRYWILVDLLFEILPGAIEDEAQLVSHLKRLYTHDGLAPRMADLFSAEAPHIADHLAYVLSDREFTEDFLSTEDGQWLKQLVVSHRVQGTSLSPKPTIETQPHAKHAPSETISAAQTVARHRAMAQNRQEESRAQAIAQARGLVGNQMQATVPVPDLNQGAQQQEEEEGMTLDNDD